MRGKPLSDHLRHLPRDVCWNVDPSGANERAEMRLANFQVRPGLSALRDGIAAVTARLESGRPKVLAGRCPNLLAEAGLYCYSEAPHERNAEVPVDEYNHALAALRYMVARLDVGRVGVLRGEPGREAEKPAAPKGPRPWLRLDNEELWTPL